MFLGGILWQRANRHGAWAATVLAFVIYYALNYLMTCSARRPRAATLREALAGARRRLVRAGAGRLPRQRPAGCSSTAGRPARSAGRCCSASLGLILVSLAHPAGRPPADRAVLRQHAAIDRRRGPARGTAETPGRRRRQGPAAAGPAGLADAPSVGAASSAATARTWSASCWPGASSSAWSASPGSCCGSDSDDGRLPRNQPRGPRVARFPSRFSAMGSVLQRTVGVTAVERQRWPSSCVAVTRGGQ